MKKILNKLAREESGQALILVMILLLVGSIIITPLLGFMSTGILAGQMLEERMDELYAADAGVEDAIWNLDDGLVVPEGPPATLTPFTINGKDVDVTILNVGAQAAYKITSIASGGSGSNTRLEVYIRNANLLNNAVTSRGEIDFQPGSLADGNTEEYYDGYWPTAEELIAFYIDQVESTDPYDDDKIDLDGVDASIGPEYIEGDFNIYNSDNTEATLTLDGTIYVTGNLNIGKTQKAFTLNLSNQTIFVEGNIDIGVQTTITGSGAIIAIGDVRFKPNMDSNPGDFVFIMSLEGTVEMQPNGAFYGSLAGDVEVQLQPGSTITWTPPPPGLNLLGAMEEALWKILTWDISLE